MNYATTLLDTIPVVLGPIGTAIMGIIIFIQAVMNAYSWRKSTQAANLKGAVDAMKVELDIYRAKTERLDTEMKQVIVREEKCQRDLDRVTRWYLEAKGEEEEMEREKRRSRGGA